MLQAAHPREHSMLLTMACGTAGEPMVEKDLLWQTGTITLVINFNDKIDQVETTDASVNATCSGQTATLTFASTAENPLTIGVHLNHGTSIDNLKMTGFTYSVV